mmetsp:Transcript_30288/g.40249  ORF Transcript_30288/g.40249 Transcript_30288/m.40249 type:complete len:92 (+) Transcript_30288:186-461(+)
MLKNIAALASREQALLLHRKTNNEKRIKTLTEFAQAYEESQQEDDFVMLSKSQNRHQDLEKSLQKLPRLQFNKVFTDFRRDIEACSIAKAV